MEICNKCLTKWRCFLNSNCIKTSLHFPTFTLLHIPSHHFSCHCRWPWKLIRCHYKGVIKGRGWLIPYLNCSNKQYYCNYCLTTGLCSVNSAVVWGSPWRQKRLYNKQKWKCLKEMFLIKMSASKQIKDTKVKCISTSLNVWTDKYPVYNVYHQKLATLYFLKNKKRLRRNKCTQKFAQWIGVSEELSNPRNNVLKTLCHEWVSQLKWVYLILSVAWVEVSQGLMEWLIGSVLSAITNTPGSEQSTPLIKLHISLISLFSPVSPCSYLNRSLPQLFAD